MDMALRTVTIWVEGRKFVIPPVDKARSPEDTVNFLNRLATNCVGITRKGPAPAPAM
jgi:triphosphoribosyl-dephospho-CoA synthetase